LEFNCYANENKIRIKKGNKEFTANKRKKGVDLKYALYD